MRPHPLVSLLIRRRHVWVPTLWGCALLLLALALAGLGAALAAYAFLAPHQPAVAHDGRGARILVVEGWLDEAELDQAVAAFRHGRYERVVATGGPIESWQTFYPWRSYAERAAGHLRTHGLEGVPVVAVAAPASAQDRTFLSAVVFREWARQSGVVLDAVDLFSAGVHARRSWLVYRMALGSGVQVGVLSARPKDYDPERWWKTSAGAKAVIGESLSLMWTKCCFWPGAAGSHEERWGAGRWGAGFGVAAGGSGGSRRRPRPNLCGSFRWISINNRNFTLNAHPGGLLLLLTGSLKPQLLALVGDPTKTAFELAAHMDFPTLGIAS